MPGPVLHDPTPTWLKPENASVFDPSWMASMRRVANFLGLTDPNQVMAILGAPLDVPTTELGGLVGAVAKKFPRLAQAIKAYHGSPHDFDQFSTSAVGTGEGAQAYGHGLYFAENPAVAEDYRRSLARPTTNNPSWRLRGEPVAVGTEHWPLAQALELAGTPDSTDNVADFLAMRATHIEQHADFVEKAYGPGAGDMYRYRAQQLRNVNPNDLTYQRPGRTYEVAIHAHPDQFLDWDKGLTQQSPAVQDAMLKLLRTEDVRPVQIRPGQFGMTRVGLSGTGELIGGAGAQWGTTPEEAINNYWANIKSMKGSDLYREITSRSGQFRKAGAFPEITVPDPAAASQAMNDAGVAGIKYLDQGSRAAGAGTQNYVVFDDQTIAILRKYGFLLPTAGAIGQQMLPSTQPSQPPPQP